MEFKFENSVGYYINKTASLMRIGLLRAFQEKYPEITVDYWVILNRLWKKDGIIQIELARLTAKDNASMTRMLDGMQRKGILSRQSDENDRRAYRIFLTQKGKELEMPLKKIAGENHGKALNNLSETDIENLKRILKTISDNY